MVIFYPVLNISSPLATLSAIPFYMNTITMQTMRRRYMIAKRHTNLFLVVILRPMVDERETGLNMPSFSRSCGKIEFLMLLQEECAEKSSEIVTMRKRQQGRMKQNAYSSSYSIQYDCSFYSAYEQTDTVMMNMATRNVIPCMRMPADHFMKQSEILRRHKIMMKAIIVPVNGKTAPNDVQQLITSML